MIPYNHNTEVHRMTHTKLNIARTGFPHHEAFPQVMKHYTMHTRHQYYILITTTAWNCLQCAPGISANSQSHFSSSSTNQYKALWKPLCLPIPSSLLFSSESGHFHTEQNKNLTSNLNFGHSSLSHSFHTMSIPPTISSLWLREDTVQEVSHLMNVHFHFRVQ